MYLRLSSAFVFFLAVAQAGDGLVRYDSPGTPQTESAAVDSWLHDRSDLKGASWRSTARQQDATHTHNIYDLVVNGRRVIDVRVKVHYNRRGWVDAASGMPDRLSSVVDAPSGEAKRQELQSKAAEDFKQSFGKEPNRLDAEPVAWIDDRAGNLRPAVQFTLVDTPTGAIRRWVTDENSGVLLREIPVVRYASVFAKYPQAPTFDNVVSVALPGLQSANTMHSTRMWVRNDQMNSTPVEIDPTLNYVGAGIANDPGGYNSGCTGGGIGCPNQGIDGVNVYYHLEGYREAVDANFSAMGVSPQLLTDPELRVFIDFKSLDLDGDGIKGNEANNAAYISAPCRSDENADRCLVFLPPSQIIQSSTCGNNKKLRTLAREALVIVHEYQHYITDRITGMLPGASASVGDALHEGYSDYFAVSHVSATAGEDVTLVGAYAFEECPAVQREIGTPQPFANSDADSDPHYGGMTWATGLFQLRREFGKTVVDHLALRSLFFMPTKPGFHDAVESLVKADQVLNAGTHAERIRELFYGDLTFLGGSTAVFTDVKRGIAEVGFQSCAGVAAGATSSSALASLGLALIWLFGSVGLARRGRR